MYRTELIGYYVNFDDEKRTGLIVGASHDGAMVKMNWEAFQKWHDEFARGVKPENRSEYPGSESRIVPYEQITELLSKDAKYLVESVVLQPKSAKIQPIQRTNKPSQNPVPPVANRENGSPTPLRMRSGSSQEIEIMAQCAVFDSENELVEIYASKKEAKAHNKGTDLVFIDAKNFPEGGIGEYATVEDLFPPKEKPVKAEGEKRERTNSVPLIGGYTVVKADAARFGEDDARAAIHAALVQNNNFEDYFAATPESYEFTTSGGKVVADTPKIFARYAIRRGWITVGDVVVEDAE